MTFSKPVDGGPKFAIAATALEEFWETAHPLIFLGEGCKRYSRKHYWSGLRSETLEFEFYDGQAPATIAYLKEVYASLLPVLTRTLNTIHNVDFSVRFWQIAIGPWLLYYLHITHDKYRKISCVRQKYPDFTTICLDESCFVIPQNTFDFIGHIKGDAYNLQLYSKILVLLGYKFPKKRIETKIKNTAPAPSPFSLKSLKATLVKGIAALARVSRNKNRVFYIDTYFPGLAAVRLALRTGGKFWPLSCGFETPASQRIDDEARGVIGKVKFGNDGFENLLMPLIAG